MKIILLAGGLGTRLKETLRDIPKPMAPINSKPFLEYQFMRFRTQGFSEFILSIGHQGEIIRDYFGNGHRLGLAIRYTVETDLLGTGGALKLAEPIIDSEDFLLANGDTYLEADLRAALRFHEEKEALGTILLVYRNDTGRYGRVHLDDRARIVSFTEKSLNGYAGYINAGIYIFRKDLFRYIPENRVCSLEREILPSLIGEGLYGFPVEGYFIDIGIPEDYEKAKKELPLRRTL